jgi:hypothetical protein
MPLPLLAARAVPAVWSARTTGLLRSAAFGSLPLQHLLPVNAAAVWLPAQTPSGREHQMQSEVPRQKKMAGAAHGDTRRLCRPDAGVLAVAVMIGVNPRTMHGNALVTRLDKGLRLSGLWSRRVGADGISERR